ncbi:hypothetical protein AB0K48_09840 [Nonomuraea sp. NPDC055795]
MSARQRYDCAESMIGAGFGGTVLGAMARSLFVDGLRWLWIGESPERLRSLLGDLLQERNRICIVLEETEASCPNLARWLMPIPDVADLTGASLSWLDARPVPGEAELLDSFLAGTSEFAASDEATPLLRHTAALFNLAGLRGAVLVLAFAGHGNYLGLQSSLTQDGAIGHDLRADHEALFMHVAAAGVTATLLGSAVALPDAWPADVPRTPFLEHAIDLAAEVAAAALPIHGLATRPMAPRAAPRRGARERAMPLLRPCAILTERDLLPDIASVEAVAAAAEEFFDLSRSITVAPWAAGRHPSLHSMLTFGGAHSGLQTVISTYDQRGSEVISVFAARMLLEEAARLNWRFSVQGEEFEARAKQYFDEFRARRKKTIDLLTGDGVPSVDARRVFDKPRNVVLVTPDDQIAKGRTPIPSVTEMLTILGEPFPESGWLNVAYSLLSQITHSTPIGLLHTVRHRDGIWHGNELSPEMLALSLDTACFAASHLIGLSTVLLTDLSPSSLDFQNALFQQAARVHALARPIHWLD